MKKLIVSMLIILLTGELASHAQVRTWTDKKGNTIEAEFVNLVAGKVILKTANGKQIKVPQSGLSSADQKFLESAIPPSFDIEVDIKNDSKKVSESIDYTRTREKVKGNITIIKKNREPSNKTFKAIVFLFSEDLETKELKVISKSEHEFSFEETKKVVFTSDSGEAEYTKRDSSYSAGKEGDKYEGYLVIIKNASGEIVDTKGSRPLFEDEAPTILKEKKGSTFDPKFRKAK